MLAAFLLMQTATPAWPWVGDAHPPAHVLRLGQPTVITGRWAGKPTRIKFTMTIVPNCRTASWLVGAVADRQDRCTRIGELEIVVGGRAMVLASPTYADLGGVRDVVIRFLPTRLFIFMRGPDGPEYYETTLEFTQRDLARRSLDLGEAGTEVTTYHPAPHAER